MRGSRGKLTQVEDGGGADGSGAVEMAHKIRELCQKCLRLRG
jgi:hypothetical protein